MFKSYIISKTLKFSPYWVQAIKSQESYQHCKNTNGNGLIFQVVYKYLLKLLNPRTWQCSVEIGYSRGWIGSTSLVMTINIVFSNTSRYFCAGNHKSHCQTDFVVVTVRVVRQHTCTYNWWIILTAFGPMEPVVASYPYSHYVACCTVSSAGQSLSPLVSQRMLL